MISCQDSSNEAVIVLRLYKDSIGNFACMSGFELSNNLTNTILEKSIDSITLYAMSFALFRNRFKHYLNKSN